MRHKTMAQVDLRISFERHERACIAYTSIHTNLISQLTSCSLTQLSGPI